MASKEKHEGEIPYLEDSSGVLGSLEGDESRDKRRGGWGERRGEVRGIITPSPYLKDNGYFVVKVIC